MAGTLNVLGLTWQGSGAISTGTKVLRVGTFAPTLSRSAISTMKDKSPRKEGSLWTGDTTMQRKVFDFIASAGGAVMVIVLVVAGVLLMWGYSFANSNVHN